MSLAYRETVLSITFVQGLDSKETRQSIFNLNLFLTVFPAVKRFKLTLVMPDEHFQILEWTPLSDVVAPVIVELSYFVMFDVVALLRVVVSD